MTWQEALDLIAHLQRLYPRPVLPDTTVAEWAKALQGQTHAAGERAVLRLGMTEPRMPSLADLLTAIKDEEPMDEKSLEAAIKRTPQEDFEDLDPRVELGAVRYQLERIKDREGPVWEPLRKNLEHYEKRLLEKISGPTH